MKKNILSILLLSNLLVFGFLFCSYKLGSKTAESPTLYIVEYSKGSKWDNGKDFDAQKYAKHHSAHLQNLRMQGVIQFGARYSDKGIVFIESESLEKARQMVDSDSAIINKMFAATVNELNVFYEYKTEKSTAKIPSGKVTGIGGVFFKSKNAKTLNTWYYDNLGLVPNDYGSMFEWRNSDDKSIAYTQWSPFSAKTKYFAPSKKDYMINYRVDDMQVLLKKLKANNVVILDTIEAYDYGKFLHILDCDSNKIELWEPVDGSFTRLYEGKTTK
ncbi:MAG TPA: hypothetical protein VGC65_07800 [Bacteroidia bacterium]|jgi:predicted enzyme related to lactoylglutathione lyase/uncharacterized protein YciI